MLSLCNVALVTALSLQIKTFLRQMGQPIDRDSLHTILMDEAQVGRPDVANEHACPHA